MPHAVATASVAKAVIAKACTAALVIGASGAAYVSFGTPESEDLGSVSVEYAPDQRQELAFAFDRTPEGVVVQVPARYDGEPAETTQRGEPGTNHDGWNESDNNPVAKSGDEEPASTSPKADTDADTESKEAAAEEEHPVAPETEKPETEKPKADKVAPVLEILYPADGSHHDNKVVTFKGVTEPGAEVFAGRYAAKVDAEGNWSIELVLSPGANGAQLTATDDAGNTTYSKVTVWLDVAEEKPAEPKSEDNDDDKDTEEDTEKETEKETEADKEVEFYAKQKYGTCDAEVAYEKFWGTATPNTLVEISSAYGSGVAEVSKNGHWEIKVYFPSAPRNEPFNIKVSGANGSADFTFVAKSWEEAEDK